MQTDIQSVAYTLVGSLSASLTMSSSENIAMRELPAADPGEQDLQMTTVDEGFNLEQTRDRQSTSNSKRACVLIGNGILQLPIWGR